jgi:hypothetical protein
MKNSLDGQHENREARISTPLITCLPLPHRPVILAVKYGAQNLLAGGLAFDPGNLPAEAGVDFRLLLNKRFGLGQPVGPG